MWEILVQHFIHCDSDKPVRVPRVFVCVCERDGERDLLNYFLALSCRTIPNAVTSTTAKWVAVAHKLNLDDLLVLRTLQMSPWLHVVCDGSNQTTVCFPRFHGRRIALTDEATDDISVRCQDLNTFRTSSDFLQQNKKVVCRLQERSRNMVSAKEVASFLFFHFFSTNYD